MSNKYRALPSRKCSIKALAKCKSSVYVLTDIFLYWSEWLVPIQGDGIGALTFGNCNKLGKVVAYLNDKEITTVGPKTETQIEFSFQDGDILKIVEFDVAIIMFNDFKVVTCYESCIGKYYPSIRM